MAELSKRVREYAVGDLPDLSGVAHPPTRWAWGGRAFAKAMLGTGFDIRVRGLDQVPRHGSVILASNHVGYLDGPLLGAVTPRIVHALVKEEMFVGRLGRMLERTGQIAIDRSVVDTLAVKRCLRVLHDGGAVSIYPEGNRGLGDVATTKGGAAYLALVSGAPVVPIACLGTRTAGATIHTMPKRGSRLYIVFGAPVRFDPVPWPRTKQRVAAVQAELQRVLAAHVRAACEMTGQTLPAMPTTS